VSDSSEDGVQEIPQW